MSLLGSKSLQLGREGRREGGKERKRDRDRDREEDREGEEEGEGDRHWGKRTQKYGKGICLERKHESR